MLRNFLLHKEELIAVFVIYTETAFSFFVDFVLFTNDL